LTREYSVDSFKELFLTVEKASREYVKRKEKISFKRFIMRAFNAIVRVKVYHFEFNAVYKSSINSFLFIFRHNRKAAYNIHRTCEMIVLAIKNENCTQFPRKKSYEIISIKLKFDAINELE
jgi:hypothetical protein